MTCKPRFLNHLPQLRSEVVCLLASLLLLMALNPVFWQRLLSIQHSGEFSYFTLAGLALALLTLFIFLLNLIALPWLMRPMLALLFPLSAAASYFMVHYGVVFDAEMVRNVVQTDINEARDLLSADLVLQILLMGGLPALIFLLIPVRWRSAGGEIKRLLIVAAVCTTVLGVMAIAGFQQAASLARNHHDLRRMLIPLNYLHATARFVKQRLKQPDHLLAWGRDAHQTDRVHKQNHARLTVIVVGETVRADHLSINGYARATTPQLEKLPDLLNWTNVWSCGTETAISVPCMFSGMRRQQFDPELAQQRENLLDIIQRAGVRVKWDDNQSGCKGVCNRVPHRIMREARAYPGCDDEGCPDEILLQSLQQTLRDAQADPSTEYLLVLHTMGSHGPAYFKRYASHDEVFKPACHTAALNQCTSAQIQNAYDNSIRATDALLARMITQLQQAPALDGAFIYLSDHGESLGEYGLWLHGTPWSLAPDAQKHVPMVMWLSGLRQQRLALDRNCLQRHTARRVEQDQLFDTVLSLLQVQTIVHEQERNVLHACERHHLS